MRTELASGGEGSQHPSPHAPRPDELSARSEHRVEARGWDPSGGALKAHPAASLMGRRERLPLDIWEAEQLSCPLPRKSPRALIQPHAPHPSTWIRGAAGSRGCWGTGRGGEHARLKPINPALVTECRDRRALCCMRTRHAGWREVIDQAPVVSLSLWTFKGTIWHPEQAIDERQLTPVANSRQQVDGPTWGTVGRRPPSRALRR